MSADKINPENENGAAELQTIRNLRKREEEDSGFSLGKGAVAGIVGKVAGTAIVTTAQEGIKNKLKNELLGDPSVREALNKAVHPAERESIIKGAMKNAISHMDGLRGNLLRNSWAWKFGGGAVAGLGMLGLEYASHLRSKEKADDNINDLKKLEDLWVKRLENERQSTAHQER